MQKKMYYTITRFARLHTLPDFVLACWGGGDIYTGVAAMHILYLSNIFKSNNFVTYRFVTFNFSA